MTTMMMETKQQHIQLLAVCVGNMIPPLVWTFNFLLLFAHTEWILKHSNLRLRAFKSVILKFPVYFSIESCFSISHDHFKKTYTSDCLLYIYFLNNYFIYIYIIYLFISTTHHKSETHFSSFWALLSPLSLSLSLSTSHVHRCGYVIH